MEPIDSSLQTIHTAETQKPIDDGRGGRVAQMVGPVACYVAAGLSTVLAFESDPETSAASLITAVAFGGLGFAWHKIENHAASQPLKNG